MVPPAEKLTCEPEPAVPAVVTDRTTAEYIVALAGAGQSCRSALGFVREWAGRMGEKR